MDSATQIYVGAAVTIIVAAIGAFSERNRRVAKRTEDRVNKLEVSVDGNLKKLLRATAHIASTRGKEIGKEIGRKDEMKRTQALKPVERRKPKGKK